LSGLFRSPWIPLGISVEKSGLEVAGLDLGSGLIMGDPGIGSFRGKHGAVVPSNQNRMF